MSTSLVPNGDSIATKVQDQTQPYGLTDVTQDLLDAHAHRPGLFKDDLVKANAALQANQTLTDMSIIGVDGKDLIASDSQGQKFLLDTTNPSNRKALSADLVTTQIGANGRTADLAADGSGKYTVVSGDSCWKVANDILTSQGVEQPSDNQIANYIKELEQNNGRSFARLQVGDEINIPTMVQGGDNHFTPNPSEVPSETPTDTNVPDSISQQILDQAGRDKQSIDQEFSAMTDGLNRATQFDTPQGADNHISATIDDVNKALTLSDLSATEKTGLDLLVQHFDTIKNADGTISIADLNSSLTATKADIDSEAQRKIGSEVQPEQTTEPAQPTSDSAEKLKNSLDQIDSDFDSIGQGYLIAVEHPNANPPYTSSTINRDDVKAAMARTDLNAAERTGLQILDENFESLQNSETGTIGYADLANDKAILVKMINDQYGPGSGTTDTTAPVDFSVPADSSVPVDTTVQNDTSVLNDTTVPVDNSGTDTSSNGVFFNPYPDFTPEGYPTNN